MSTFPSGVEFSAHSVPARGGFGAATVGAAWPGGNPPGGGAPLWAGGCKLGTAGGVIAGLGVGTVPGGGGWLFGGGILGPGGGRWWGGGWKVPGGGGPPGIFWWGGGNPPGGNIAPAKLSGGIAGLHKKPMTRLQTNS